MILDDKGVDDLVDELNRAVENGATVKCYKRSNSNEPDWINRLEVASPSEREP